MTGIRGVLLDIEGTTSSVAFVYEVLFPYARRELADFLRRRWAEPDTVHACERIARDAGRRRCRRGSARTRRRSPRGSASPPRRCG